MGWKERHPGVRDLRALSSAAPLPEAEEALELFAQTWAQKEPTISASWRRDWARLTRCVTYPPAIQKVTYTPNAIESWNYSLLKGLKTRSAFPTDEAIWKVLDLGKQRIAKKWTVPIPEWKRTLTQMAILAGGRVSTIECPQSVTPKT